MALAGLALTTSGLATASAAGAARTSLQSTPVTSFTVSGRLLAVAATSPTNAWAVGYSGGQNLILHWNGTAWTQVPSPTPVGGGYLTGVAATSPDNAWAVGFTNPSPSCLGCQTLILHWDGTAWTQVPSPNPSALDQLLAVAATSPVNAWAVGCASDCGGDSPQTLILHWDGTAWTQVPSPAGALGAVAATSPRSAWAAGEGYPILNWDGTAWTQTTSPPGGISAMAATSPGNAWAVGSTFGPTSQTVTVHWNGTAWTQVPSPTPEPGSYLAGVAATSPVNAWAVGQTDTTDSNCSIVTTVQTLILHWDGTAWTQVPSPSPGAASCLAGVAATSPTNAWAVGRSDASTSEKTLILHWDGTAWN